jgi:SAM-dependent methyltransferase
VSEPQRCDAVAAHTLWAPGWDAVAQGDALRRAEGDLLRQLVVASGCHKGRVLDLGCGTGRVLDWFGDGIAPRDYLGVDNCQAMLDTCRRKHPEHADGMILGDAATVELGRRADNVIALGVLPYVAHPRALVSAIYRHLPPGGKFIVTAYGPPMQRRPRPGGIEVAGVHYVTAHELQSIFRWCFPRTQVQSFGIARDAGRWPHGAMLRRLRFERQVVGRLAPNACAWHVITGRKPMSPVMRLLLHSSVTT